MIGASIDWKHLNIDELVRLNYDFFFDHQVLFLVGPSLVERK